MTTYELSLCKDCIYTDSVGWNEEWIGRPLPDPVPMSLLTGWLISPNTDHECEGHFTNWGSCDGCGTHLGGNRYCYTGTPTLLANKEA